MRKNELPVNKPNEQVEQTGATLVVMQNLLDSLQRGDNIQAVKNWMKRLMAWLPKPTCVSIVRSMI